MSICWEVNEMEENVGKEREEGIAITTRFPVTRFLSEVSAIVVHYKDIGIQENL